MFNGRVRILALALSLLQRFDGNTTNPNEKGQQNEASVKQLQVKPRFQDAAVAHQQRLAKQEYKLQEGNILNWDRVGILLGI